MTSPSFDALLLVSFGGPEGPEDVLPFLDNVLRGRNVPAERKAEVAEHYYRFGGVSPINQQNRQLLAALRDEFQQAAIALPLYWGNRNWHPLLAETLRQMSRDGVQHALALFTTAFSSYSSCRQYLDAIEQARQEIGAGAPRVSKLRTYCNHPRFVEAWIDRARGVLQRDGAPATSAPYVLFTAHSIPVAMAEGSAYVAQLHELASLIAARLEVPRSAWQLVYQSRSGPPQQPWLEPDVCAAIRDLAARRVTSHIVLVPIGFLSDHIEVLFDLDVEAVQVAEEAGVTLTRAATVGTHSQFVSMVRELVVERLENQTQRVAVGTMGPFPDTCAPHCCRYEVTGRPPAAIA